MKCKILKQSIFFDDIIVLEVLSMKLNYKLLRMSCIIMIITLILSVILTFLLEQTNLIQFLNSISLNIFAGAVILFATSLIEYFINRRKDLESIMNYVLKYRNIFAKINYLNNAKYLTYDEYKKKFNKKDDTAEKMFKLSDECDEFNKNNFNNFDEIIDTYLDIAEINFNDFWAIYDDLRFIFKNKLIKLRFHQEIFEKIYDEVNKIRELSYHLNIYKTKGANPIIMYEKIRNYQKNIFYEKRIPNEETLDEENMQLIKNGLAYESIYTENGSLFIYNKFVKYLDDEYVKIGKIAYFDENYTGYGD
mgnify:CR=1 FL=1